MEVIANKYRVLKTLGNGAMGEVFLVMPPRGDPVALKLLKTLDAKSNKEAIEQFENEFKVLKKLSHPNIGKIFDYGFDEECQKVFFTLPWLKGCDIFKATEHLSFEECEDLFVQTLRALNYLHQKNFIHCDLKPGNIYVEGKEIILLDFGLAGYFGDNIVGTPTYLAPEIYRGTKHNVLSDLYACGVIFYNCLSRLQPFSGKNLQEVYDRHRSFIPPPLAEVSSKVPKYFSDIVAMLLNKKPEERFQSAVAVIEEIAAFSKKQYSVETEETLLSYLPTQSDLVGMDDTIRDVEVAISHFLRQESDKNFHIIVVTGPRGVGKSKVVAKIRNDLQIAKISVEDALPPFTPHDQSVLLSAKAVVFEDLASCLSGKNGEASLKELIDLLEEKIVATISSHMMLVLSHTSEQELERILNIFPAEDTRVSTIEMRPYTREETRDFLITIIGQKEIPQIFVDQFYRNTEGLAGVGQQLIQTMIQDGVLFDKSGRWNEDLLSNLEKAFEKLHVSESMEQQFEKLYEDLGDAEEEIVNWLAVCPHPVPLSTLHLILKRDDLKSVLTGMVNRHIVREEDGHFSLYRSVFQNFVRSTLPDKDVRRRHTQLALPACGLEKKYAIYHLSQGNDRKLAARATVKLAELYEREGERVKAFETYERLICECREWPVDDRLTWHIKASTLLIWLDRFKEAEDLLTLIEKEIIKTKPKVSPALFLSLIEKKGLALLHLERIDESIRYFNKGLKHAEKLENCRVQQLRFENNLAQIEVVQGHPEVAITIFEKSRQAAKALPLAELQEITNNDLGHVHLQMRNFVSAIHDLTEDIRIFSAILNREPLARALYSYAGALRSQNDVPRAIAAYNECITICKHGHFFPLLLRVYNGLGNLYLSIPQHDEALKCYQKGVEIAVRLQAVTLKAALLINQGRIYHQSQNIALATRRFLMAKQVLEMKEPKLAYDDLLLSKCYNELAILAVDERNSMKALSYQLERMKLVDHSDTLRPEKFSVKVDLAELYLENRLREQFLREIAELPTLAQTDEERSQIARLNTRWEEIQANTEQDSTANLSHEAEGIA